MILEWILDYLQTALSWAVAPLPDDTTEVWTYVNSIAGNLGALNYFLPIAETVSLVVGLFVIFPIFLGISVVLWIVAQLRGSSSVG